MQFPDKLLKYDTIAIVSTSSTVSKEDAFKCKKLIEDLGFEAVLYENTYNPLHGYKAGTGEEKANILNDLFSDKNIKAIFCIRGGISSCHMMDKLDINIIKNNPKIFVGYSDVTNLHLYFNQEADLVTFHGPMVYSNMLNDFDNFTKDSFYKALNMEEQLLFENPENEDLKIANKGKAKGNIIGGNLALITTSLGTHYEINTDNKILFLEDINENVGKVDRMLHHLKYAGKFDKVSGIIFGDFKNCHNEDDTQYCIEELICDFFKDYNFPVLYNIKSGHCFPMATIPLGSRCEVNTHEKYIKFFKH